MPLEIIKGSFGPNANRPLHLLHKTKLIENLILHGDDADRQFLVLPIDCSVNSFQDTEMVVFTYSDLFSDMKTVQFMDRLKSEGMKTVVIEEGYNKPAYKHYRDELKQFVQYLADLTDVYVYVIGDLMDTE